MSRVHIMVTGSVHAACMQHTDTRPHKTTCGVFGHWATLSSAQTWHNSLPRPRGWAILHESDYYSCLMAHQTWLAPAVLAAVRQSGVQRSRCRHHTTPTRGQIASSASPGSGLLVWACQAQRFGHGHSGPFPQAHADFPKPCAWTPA